MLEKVCASHSGDSLQTLGSWESWGLYLHSILSYALGALCRQLFSCWTLRQASFPDCFSSWPVQTGSSCTSGASPSPSPTTQATTRALATTTQATTTTTTTTTRMTATMPTVPPTSTKEPTSTKGPTSCAAAGDDCRDAGCCQQAGHTCYEKAFARGSTKLVGGSANKSVKGF